MRKTLTCLFIFVLINKIPAQEINIIPQPKSVKQPKIAASFNITSATQIVCEGGNMNNITDFLSNYLNKFYYYQLKVVSTSASKNVIRLNYERLDNAIPGAYNMTVDANGIYIAGDNEEGLFYGIQTLIQLLPLPGKAATGLTKLEIPYISIEDKPRFAYRGLHLDVSRHFWPVDFVKKYIDYIALHKMNFFHWHLTDDQGWRIEIKKYPKLTEIGSKRNGTLVGRYPGSGSDNTPHEGFYTQEQIKEVVQYAKDRYIEVVPEIDVPGHSCATIAAYPWLSCFPNEPSKFPPNMISAKSVEEMKNGRIKFVQETWGTFEDVLCPGNDSTFLFMENVFDEMNKLFPSKYFHVGGDECLKSHWKICPKCQQRMKENNLKDEHELQSYFIKRLERYLNSKGKTVIGWDEILEGGLAPNAVVMSWQGEKGGIIAAKQSHDVIMTPGNPVYFDHTQSENEDSITFGGYNPIEKVYAYEPVPKELNEAQAKHILGAQANLWAEYILNTKKIEYSLFPRLSALSEILWSPKEKRNWSDFEKRLQVQFKRYDLWKVNYSKAYFDLKATVLPAANNNGLLWKLESKVANSKINYTKKMEITDPPNPPAFNIYSAPILIKKGGEYNGWTVQNGKSMGNTITQKFSFNKATGKKITLSTPASDKYPGDGAFTLINGVINEKGFARSKEFVGFSGTDCEAIIDLGSSQSISSVVINALNRPTGWIWKPRSAEVYGSGDGTNWFLLKTTDDFIETKNGNGKGTMTLSFNAANTQFVKVLIKNYGIIPEGNAGAGSKAWLFVDEIEAN